MPLLLKTVSRPILVEHGITTSIAECQAHVCILALKAYLFWRLAALKVMFSYPEREVIVDGVVCGRGRAVPVQAIKPMFVADIPREWVSHVRQDMDKSQLGRCGECIFERCAYLGLFGFRFSLKFYPMSSWEQVHGLDATFLEDGYGVEIKCDYPGGERPLGTGNLFLQQFEINRKKQW